MPVPAPALLARWAVKYGPLVVPVAKRLYEEGRFRQLAILHARTIVQGTFSWEMSSGQRVWVVWSGDEVVATYPEVEGTPDGLFLGALADRRLNANDVVVRRVKRRVAAMPRPSLPARLRRGAAAQDEHGLDESGAWRDAPPPRLSRSDG